jgi:hypothetical protein
MNDVNKPTLKITLRAVAKRLDQAAPPGGMRRHGGGTCDTRTCFCDSFGWWTKKIECHLVAGDPKLKYARMTVPTEGVEMKIRRNYKQILQIKISPKSSYF